MSTYAKPAAIVQRKAFTLASFDVNIGDAVGDVTWNRIVPGSGWIVLSRGFDAFPNGGPSRGMWLKIQKEWWHVTDADVAAAGISTIEPPELHFNQDDPRSRK